MFMIFVHIQSNSKNSVSKNIGPQIQNAASTGTTSSAIIPGVIKVIAIVIQIQENPRTVAFSSGVEYLRWQRQTAWLAKRMTA